MSSLAESQATAAGKQSKAFASGKQSKRFNLDLSQEAYQDMEALGEMSGGRTKVEVFRLALALLKTVYPAILRGEELCLVNREAKTETRIVILIPR